MDEIKIRVQTDVSQLQTAMDSGADSVGEFAARTTAALAEYADACTLGDEATEFLAKAMQKASASGATYVQAVEQATAAFDTYISKMHEATSATSEEGQAAETAAAKTAALGVSARTAASAGIGILEGRMMSGNRAAAAFLSTTLGLGPILEAAFPVIGALAFAEVAVSIGEKLGSVAFEAMEVGNALGGDMWTGAAAMLQGIGAGFDALAQEEASLRKQTVDLATHNTELFATFLRLSEGPKIAGDYLDRANKAAAEGVQAKLRDAIGTLKQLEQAAAQVQEVDTSQGISHEPTRGAQEAKLQLGRQQQLVAELSQEDQKYQLTAMNARTKGNQEQQRLDDEATRKRLAAARAADEQLLRELERNLAEQENLHGKSPAIEAAYWDQFLGTFRHDTSEYSVIMERLNRAQEQLGRKESSDDLFGQQRKQLERLVKTAAEDAAKLQHIYDEMDQTARKVLSETVTKPDQQANALAAERSHEQTEGALQVKQAQVENADYTGVNPKVELEALQQLHQQELAETERYIKQEMALYAQEPDKLRQLQKELDEVHTKGLVQQATDTARILKQEQAIYVKTYDTIAQDFNATINKFITSTEKPAQAFAQMFNQMLAQGANFVEKMLEQDALMWAKRAILGETAQASTAAATITSDAAVAGAGAYAATAGIPFVGPALAPAAAASAYAATLGFLGLAAFEKGGIVGGMSGMPVPIMAHAGERVLSAPQTQNFERMVNQPSGRGGNVHVNYAPSISAYDRSGMRSMLEEHREDVVNIVRHAINSGSLSM